MPRNRKKYRQKLSFIAHFQQKLSLSQISFISIRKQWPWVLALLLWGVTLAALSWMIFGPVFRIKTITCSLDSVVNCDQTTLAILEQVKGEHSLFFDAQNLTDKLYQVLPTSDSLQAQVVLPSNLLISIQSGTPIAQVVTASDSAALLISQSRRVLGLQKTQNEQIITIQKKRVVPSQTGSEVDDPLLSFTLDLLESLSERGIQLENIEIISEQRIYIELDQGKTAIVSSLQPLARQVHSLQVILAKATMTEALPVIDLRYTKPVLKKSLD